MTTPLWDHLLLGGTLATMGGTDGYGLVEQGALAWHDGAITFAGPLADLPGHPDRLARQVQSVHGALITPGLIDCHTHLVFAGSRAEEFELRLHGASYEDVARAGGGILSTVRHTRAADEDTLLAQSLPRAQALLAEGVTTIEIKSGYGLDLASERAMLRVARRIGSELGLTVRATLLALHALPPEFAGRRDDYIDEVVTRWLPALAGEGLVDAVDAFCEPIAFSRAETARLFDAARTLGIPLKLHAEQLSDSGGAGLAAAFDALSADHLEWINADDVRAMAAAGTVAVLLPGAYYCLRDTRPPPIAAFRAEGVAMAVATDLNPGTSPMASLLYAMNQACVMFRLTPDEALRGATVNAAKALGLAGRKGTLKPGADADLALWPVSHPRELSYWIGGVRPTRIVIGGEDVTGLRR